MTPRQHNVISYLGALASAPVAFWFGYGSEPGRGAHLEQLSLPTALVLCFWGVHFGKRAAESAWVHRYSKPHFPLTDALQEYAYYWGFGAWIGFSLADGKGAGPLGILAPSVLFVVAVVGNGMAHQALARLRPVGGGEKQVPRGVLFRWVSCPHYFFEMLTWWSLVLLAPNWAIGSFALLVSVILGLWARQRHRAYLETFDDYPRERRSLIPLVL